MSTYAYRQAAGIRQALLDRRELALIDVREEADFATAHPLFAVNLPLSKLELEVRRRIPRFTTPLTVYDNGEGLAEIAVERLRSWGYQDVALLRTSNSGNTIPPPAPPAPGPLRWRILPNGPGWRSSMRPRCNAGCSRTTAPPSCLMSAAPKSTRRVTIPAA